MGKSLYLVGGTLRAMAAWKLRQDAGVLDDPHALALPGTEADALARFITRMEPDALRRTGGLSAMRASVLPDAAALLRVLIDHLKPETVVFSSCGLREGLLLSQLDPLAWRQDPLQAGVAAFAAPRGGRPDIATRVAAWTVNAVRSHSPERERIRLAATMLALAIMQIEPNLREAQAINWSLHKRWLNITNTERALIAAMLLANSGRSELHRDLADLASAEDLREARAWGLANRLCRRLGAFSIPSLEATALVRENAALHLLLTEEAAPLCNRGVEKDLARLGEAMELDWAITRVSGAELLQRRFGQGA